jgi:hypothetical protein
VTGGDIRLRTFLASWRRFLLVFVGCLAYLTLVEVTVRVFPSVAPALGYGWLVIVGLYLLAALAFGLIGIYLTVVVMAALTPVLRRVFADTPWAERSDKAKEKHAESLLTMSNAIASATFIAILVAPLTAFLQAMVTRRDLGSLLSPFLTPGGLPGWQLIALSVLFFVPLVFSALAKKNALDVYDELAKPALPEPPLGPNGTTATTRACPASVDPPTP